MGMKQMQVDITRPNDTTPYDAGDVVGPTAGAAASIFTEQSGMITGALLIDSVAAATKPSIDVFLFSQAPTVAADNAAFAATDAQMKFLVGVLTFDGTSGVVFKTAGANGAMQITGFQIPYTAEDRKLYVVMVARNAYTPGALEVFTLKLFLKEGE